MSQGVPTETHAGARALGTLLAALAPLLLALASSSPFVPATGGSHLLHAALAGAGAAPPGHPLAVLAVRAGTLVPLGPLALRAGLSTAVLFAVAAAALYRAIDSGLRATTALRPIVASPLALGLTLLAIGAQPQLYDGARPHAAALALACLAFERWVAFECALPRLDLRALRAAALLFGLLLAEQPAVAALLLLFALPGLRRVLREYRLPVWNLAPLAAGLPLWLDGQLARAPGLGLPQVRSPLQLLRAAFASGPGEPATAGIAGAETAELVPLALAALGLLGAALALRAPAQRKLGASWLAAGLGALAASHWLADRDAPHALALCAAAALSGFALAPLLAGDAKSRLAPVLAVALVALGIGQLQAGARAARGLDRAGADALGDALRRELPARSALLLAPELAAALLDAESEEQVRPDLLAALAPWQLDLRAAERLAAQSPELLPLLRAQLLARAPPRGDDRMHGAAALPLVELAELAARRPTLVELSPELDLALHAALLPYGLYHQVSTHGIVKPDVELAARDGERRLARLYAELDVARLHPAAARLLAARHAAELAYALGVGDDPLAERARARIAALQPAERGRP